MSTLKVDAIRHNSATSDAITTAADGTCTAKLTSIGGGGLSHRNKVINGGMIVSQRGSTFSLTNTGYALDRFQHRPSGSPTYECTITQDDDHPDGFSKSFKTTPNTTDTSLLTSDNAMIRYIFEGQDLQDLAYGTSSAKSITLSFYAKSGSQNNNHQYSVQFRKVATAGNNARKIVTAAFTVTTSWQRYTFTFAGDTGQDIRNDNQMGLELMWHLAAGPDDIHSAQSTWSSTTNAATAGSPKFTAVTGQSNFLDNTSNEFYLTGVQVEVGDTATSFEHRSITDELARCQRYYYQIGPLQSDIFAQGRTDNDDVNMYVLVHYPVTMRSAPATLTTTGSAGNYDVRRDTTKGCSAVPTITAASSTHLAQINCQSSSHGWGTASPMQLQADGGGSAFLGFSAEL